MKRLAAASLLTLVATATTVSATPQQQSSSSSEETQSTGPATTTASGTTGLWFVPTSDVLPSRKFSVSFYRTNIDDGQGFADISTFPATFAIGVGNRAEVFASWALVTRIDRDTRPLFFNGSDPSGTGGGILLNYPRQRAAWTGNKFGDLWLGAKINLISSAGAPAGVAVRLMVKAPTGSEAASSGQTDFAIDGVVSGRTPAVELSGFGGIITRGSPDGYSLTNGFRWGVGAGFPQRYGRGFRVTAELFGESYFDDTITAPAGQFGTDGSPVPTTTQIKSPVVASLGLTWQAPNGVFLGAAGSWNMGMNPREDAGAPNTPKDDMGLQFRIGYHPSGRRAAPAPVAAAPAAPVAAPPPAPAPAPPPNRPPTVKAECNPCSVEVGRTSVVSADAQDPDGDPLTYQWTAPCGSFSAPTSRQSNWTAPNTPGPCQVTVSVSDGRGGTASSSVTIQVTQPTQMTFEDVHFEFDRFNLRPDALQILDQAVKTMQSNPSIRMTIEGHTCNIGTAEYNLALGERRARSVRDYMTSRGIAATRLTTVSYGEERPKFDNSREETRRLNRRAALTVTLQ